MARSAPVIVTVGKILTSISINVSPTSGNAPLPVMVDGYLTETDTGNPVAGKIVTLIANGISMFDMTTNASGYYFFPVTLPTVGSWTIETEFAGDATYEGCAKSDQVTADGVPEYDLLFVAAPIISGMAMAIAL